jgi:diguanylate cyclase (GGDEF)-like protein
MTLISVARVISAHTRKSDIACRYGGEEFMLILPEMDMEDALRRAEQFRAAIEKLEVPVGEQIVRTTASIGVAVFPIQGNNSDEMFSRVDQALYLAKGKGRNQIVVYVQTP